MKFFWKKRVEIRLDVYENGRVENSITGEAYEIVRAVMCLLCAVCIDSRADGVSRGELREGVMAQVGETFDDVWRKKVLRGELE